MIRQRLNKLSPRSLARALFSSDSASNGKPPAMKPFEPTEHGLTADFVLTNFTKMKG